MELIKNVSAGREDLHGLLWAPPNGTFDGLILHIHGTWGNFYQNPFIALLAEVFLAHGWAFASVNNRGHDGGAFSERFTFCIDDIASWVVQLVRMGFSNILLQGHSLGALKVVYFANTQPRSAVVKALILLSPIDVVALYCSGAPEKRHDLLKAVAPGAGQSWDDPVPHHVWHRWLVSRSTFNDFLRLDSPADLFPFRTGRLSGSPAALIDLPTFVAIGTDDFAAHPSPDEQIAMLMELRQVHTWVARGGVHNFAGCERALGRALTGWLSKLDVLVTKNS